MMFQSFIALHFEKSSNMPNTFWQKMKDNPCSTCFKPIFRLIPGTRSAQPIRHYIHSLYFISQKKKYMYKVKRSTYSRFSVSLLCLGLTFCCFFCLFLLKRPRHAYIHTVPFYLVVNF